MLLQMAKFPSFLWLSSIVLVIQMYRTILFMEKQGTLKIAAAYLKQSQKLWLSRQTSPLSPRAEMRKEGEQCFLEAASSQEKVDAQLT